MEVHVFCALPGILASPLESGVLKNALRSGAMDVHLHDLHHLSPDPHSKIDDSPYGGGPGMVLRVDVVAAALEEAFNDDAVSLKERFPVVLVTPQGERFDQAVARSFAGEELLAFICGRYEGVDERIRQHIVSREISLGDFVISGGELAAAAILDAVARLLPGSMGNAESLEKESFSGNLLEYPHYTRPAVYRGWRVPEVLLSGDHGRVDKWRDDQARKRTMERRPDLLDPRD